jgi:ribosome-associated toxin RatA of RatAB toxin-antitoxin module
MYSLNLRINIDVPRSSLIKIWRRPDILLKEAKNIERLRITKRDKYSIYTDWLVKIDGMQLGWKQRDKLSLKEGIINFRAIDGEFKKYQGVWRIMPNENNKTLLEVEVTIDWGIPVLEKHVKKSLEKKSRFLFRRFLESIKKVAESNAT